MNKKMLLVGAVAVAGFFSLTAFDGKTLAQQKEEIAAAVTAKLDELRAEKTAECDARINTEATARFETWKAEEAAKPAPAPAKGKSKGSSKGPKVDPLPTGTKTTTDPQKTRGGAVQQGNVEQQKERGGAVQQGNVEQQKKRGGAVKQGGGN
ncbi:MAG: hypothetical protein SFV22_04040 [Saprospiraceae bacterium]|nr:hypothetical protein [Saprospiraceae bacterium]